MKKQASVLDWFKKKYYNPNANNMQRFQVTCNTYELSEHISKWLKCENSDWTFLNFEELLSILNISLPVRLIAQPSASRKYSEFLCIDANDKEYDVVLESGDSIDYASTITIETDLETKKYEIFSVSTSEIPVVTLVEREICKGRLYLNSTFYESSSTRLLYFDATNQLRINITYKGDNVNERIVHKNNEEIDSYLMSLDKNSDVNTIHSKLFQIFDYSDDELQLLHSITIKQIEVINSEEIVRAIFKIKDKKIVEYASTEENNTYHIFSNGDWYYLSENLRITYISSKNSCSLHLTNFDEFISNAEFSVLVGLVKNKISTLFEEIFSHVV